MAQTTTGIEEYLEAIYKLTAGDIGRQASTSSLAEAMSVSAPSVSEMLRRLSDQGLISYRPYLGASLTESGLAQARRVIRYHRLWERFLVDHLGLPWEDVHEEACLLEHATSPAVAERLAAYLGHPATCPHGNAVPAAASQAPSGGTATGEAPLAEAGQGFAGVVSSVSESPAVLEYCAKAGLVPGAAIEVVDVEPGEPLITVSMQPTARSGGDSPAVRETRRVVVGPKAASAIRVRPAAARVKAVQDTAKHIPQNAPDKERAQ